MIRISRNTDYAARVILHLSCLGPNAKASITDIAQVRKLPVPFVRRLIAPLIRAGLLLTVRGANGGLRLAREPKDISLADVVLAMEGPLALNDCVEDADTCPFSSRCPVNRAWDEASLNLQHMLEGYRFDALAKGIEGHAEAHARMSKKSVARASTHGH